MKRYLVTCMLLTLCTVPVMAIAQDNLSELSANTPIEMTAKHTKELSKSDKVRYDKLCNKADNLIDKKQYSQAEDIIKKAILISPESDTAYAAMASSYIGQNKYDEAKVQAQKALSINEANYIANNCMGIILNNKDRNPIEAINYYNKALKVKPDFVSSLINMAIAYGNITNYEKAIEFYTKAISHATPIKIKETNLYLQRAKSYNLINQYDLALKDIDSAIKLNSKNYMAYSLKGKILVNKKEFKNAQKYADRSIKLSNKAKDAELYLNKIYVYSQIGYSYFYLKEDFKLAEEYAGNDEYMLDQLCNSFRFFKQYDEALRVYQKILTINPNNLAIILNYANTLIEKKDYSQAETILKDFAKKNSELINTQDKYKLVYYSNMGSVKYGLAKLTNKELINEGISDFKTINNLSNKNYWIGNGYFINGDYKNAYKYYKENVKLSNNDFDTVYKILMLKELVSYSEYNSKTREWGIPDWITNNNEIPDYDWRDISDFVNDDVISRVNYANGMPRIDDKNYILNTIKMLKMGHFGISKVYNLHINDDAYGNTSRIIAYPYVDGLDNRAKTTSSADYNLILANQYFLLIKNSIMSIPKVYKVNTSEINDFFNSIENIPANIAVNYIKDLTTLSVAEWDIFDDYELSLYFYNNATDYLKSIGLDKSSNSIKQIMKAIYLGMGDYYLDEGSLEQAIHYYNCAIPYGASKFDINKFIGNYYFNKNDYFKAIGYFSKALSVKNDAEIYLHRGYSKAKTRDYDGAIADYNKAIGYNKNLKSAYWERAQVLFDQNKYSAAFNDYVKYSSFEKQDATAQYNAGICLYNIGKKQAALPYLNKAKSLAQSSGNTQLYNKSINIINGIKGYSRRYY